MNAALEPVADRLLKRYAAARKAWQDAQALASCKRKNMKRFVARNSLGLMWKNEDVLCPLHYAKRKSKRLAANGGSGP